MVENKLIKKKKFYFNKIFFKFLLKKGDINKAKTIFKQTFNILFSKTSLGSYDILTQIYLKLFINFEVRQIRVRRNYHLVPIPIRPKRRCYLICKWIFDSVNSNKKYQNFSIKLSSELLKIINNENCNSFKKKNMFIKMAKHNRSNLHYRWY